MLNEMLRYKLYKNPLLLDEINISNTEIKHTNVMVKIKKDI